MTMNAEHDASCGAERRSVLELTHVNAGYRNESIFKDVNLSIVEGEFLVIMGPSGVGKSTLLRCMNLLHPIQSGEILYNGRPIAGASAKAVKGDRLRREIGLVFQGFNLWPNKTVLENVAEGPTYSLGLSRKQAFEQAKTWIEIVGMGGFVQRYPSQLSGGQQQRVAIARALALEPKVVLLDEITSALDAESAVSILHLLESLRERKQTYVLVTHHLAFARRVADRVAIMLSHGIAEIDSPTEIFQKSVNQDSQRFLSAIREL